MNSLIFATVILLCCVTGAWPQVAVIAHRSVGEDTISKSQLLDFFTGDIKKWPDGGRVVVKNLKAKGAVRAAFYDFLGKSPSRMKSIWLKKVLSGEGDPPESLETEDEVLAKVAATPGAIGFVSKDTVNDKVKLLLLIAEKESSSLRQKRK